jgi:hypothetical protein
MKKTIIIFVVILFSCIINAYDNCPKQKDNQQNTTHFCEAEQLSNEYDYEEQHNNINEYDQHICDTAIPPKTSKIQEFFEKIIGTLLIHYFTIKGKLNFYLKQLKKEIFSYGQRRTT